MDLSNPKELIELIDKGKENTTRINSWYRDSIIRLRHNPIKKKRLEEKHDEFLRLINARIEKIK